MLRIGDFSLCTIDGRVLGIGELKTRQDGNQLQISTYLSSKVDIPKSSVNKVVDDFDLVNPEPNRLKRELEMQEELLKLARASKNLEFFDADYNFSALENAYKYSKHTAVSDDNGLAVVLLKYGERIRDYLFADKSICENFSYDKEEILKIVSHESNYNSIHFTQIKTDLVGFRRSVIWWPISEGIIRGLVMRTIEVFNWVNLAYWCDELVRLGYNVVLTKTEEPQPEYRISKEYNNKLIHFKSPEMIIDLMLHDYLTWKSAAATLNRFFEEAKVDLKENMIIEIAINQRSI